MFGLAHVSLLFALTAQNPPWWLLRRLPPWAITTTYSGIALWQWAALPTFFAFSMLSGWLIAKLLGLVLRPLARRTESTWDNDLLVMIAGPARLLFGTLIFWQIVPSVALNNGPTNFIDRGIDALIATSIFWGVSVALDIAANRATARLIATIDPRDRGGMPSLVAIGSKMAKVIVVIAGFIMVLSLLGVQVAGIIAGLGIGGVAVAFAGQKTLENLFGSFMIGVDQPLRIGDFVKVEDLQGTVEAIGLRSTRIRTFDRTVVTIPNGKLSDTRIENFAARDRIRLHTKIGIVYSTKPETVRAILGKMRQYLSERPEVFPDTILVHLTSFGDSALIIEVNTWLVSHEWVQFLTWREETLLGLMDIVESSGSAFAFPTQTVHVETMSLPTPKMDASPPNPAH